MNLDLETDSFGCPCSFPFCRSFFYFISRFLLSHCLFPLLLQYRGTESCIEFLDLPIAKGGEWRPWFFDASPVSGQFWEQKPSYWGELLASAPLSPQLGGYVKNYEGNVSFVTVHTSGHMVPQFRPAAALQLFRTTLNNMLLSPPLDVDKVSPRHSTPLKSQKASRVIKGK